MRRFQESPSRIGLAVGVSLVFSVLVDVSLRKGIADPAGSTIERSLPTLGFLGVDTIFYVKIDQAANFRVKNAKISIFGLF